MKLFPLILSLLLTNAALASSAVEFHVTLAEKRCFADGQCSHITDGGEWVELKLQSPEKDFPSYLEGRHRVENSLTNAVLHYVDIFVEVWGEEGLARINIHLGTVGNEINEVVHRFMVDDLQDFTRYELIGTPVKEHSMSSVVVKPVLEFGPKFRTVMKK